MTGADILCETLLANGVDVCFANPGTSEMHFVAALDRQPRMRCVLGLFEGVVTGAADGYARMADKPAATLLHLGPGLANGLANLHNARRASSPVVNIVGEHASYHLAHDAPLTSDIEGLARPMSGWVRTIGSADNISGDAAQAITAARGAPGQVATLILPADAAWGEAQQDGIAVAAPARLAPVTEAKLNEAAQALRSGKRTMILLTGKALRDGALDTASRIAQFSGAALAAERMAGRIPRGAGRVAIERIPYKLESAVSFLREFEQLILIGAREPVAFFAYPGKPSRLVAPECKVMELAAPGDDLVQALENLAQALNLPTTLQPLRQERIDTGLPSGALNADAVHAVVARMMPEQAIVCDESITSGQNLLRITRGAAPHDYLPLTGGAIGLGLPMATGAAVACPGRKVISLQADGSGMYTLQALWTQAREQLDVVTIIFANRSYAILHGELKNVGAGEAGRNARRMLDLDDPAMNWVSLAEGMGVEAVRVATTEQLGAALQSALKRRGPMLIEAVI
ncbi:MAG TPA: acetolactate synthase large subunit [Noviherbaspirillum sp.]|nr:acetolactate synthase large subunit [Noviherbaspirillum sp.]